MTGENAARGIVIDFATKRSLDLNSQTLEKEVIKKFMINDYSEVAEA